MGKGRNIWRNMLSRRTLMSTAVGCVFLYVTSALTADSSGNVHVAFFPSLMSIFSIISGFVASFYFFTASRGNEFLNKIDGTRSFAELMWLTRHGFLVSILSTGVFFCLSLVPVPAALPIGQTNLWLASAILVGAYSAGTIWRCALLFRDIVDPQA